MMDSYDDDEYDEDEYSHYHSRPDMAPTLQTAETKFAHPHQSLDP